MKVLWLAVLDIIFMILVYCTIRFFRSFVAQLVELVVDVSDSEVVCPN